MTISDLLTTVGILLAIFAFIGERQRDYVLLKFTGRHYILLGIMFIWIHFLLAFDWLVLKIPVLGCFLIKGWPIASSYAYIFSLLSLLFVAAVIFWFPFPLQNIDKVISFYKRLLLRNESALLIHSIDKHHLKQIDAYLEKRKQFNYVDTSDSIKKQRQTKVKFEQSINTSKLNYGSKIYNKIIRDDRFIDSASNIDPFFFIPLISQLNTTEVNDIEFVNRFVRNLVKNKNTHFIHEIKLASIQDFFQYKISEQETPILYALLGDFKVANVNLVWWSLCDEVSIEMKAEVNSKHSILSEPNTDSDNQLLWTYRIYIGIHFMKILYGQAILYNEKDFSAFIYYYRFLGYIIENCSATEADTEVVGWSHNYTMVYYLFVHMIDIIEMIVISMNDQIVRSFYHTFGLCIWKLAEASHISNEVRFQIMNMLIENIFLLSKEKDLQTKVIDKLQNDFLTLLKKPVENSIMLIKPGLQSKYSAFLLEVWDHIDQAKFGGPSDILIERLKTEVLGIIEN